MGIQSIILISVCAVCIAMITAQPPYRRMDGRGPRSDEPQRDWPRWDGPRWDWQAPRLVSGQAYNIYIFVTTLHIWFFYYFVIINRHILVYTNTNIVHISSWYAIMAVYVVVRYISYGKHEVLPADNIESLITNKNNIIVFIANWIYHARVVEFCIF
jgi:hypothetical protein